MIKFSSNTDFDFDVESVSIITDGKQLVKRASAKELLKFKRTKGQTDLHIIALGAYEGYGPNRNLDRWDEKDCETRYQTFRQADRAVHRHHKNKKKDPKFGNIKAAAYNKPMKRIELIIGLDNDKCADILSEQEKTGSTCWSMAAKIPYDVCTWCGKKARNDAERCEHIPDQLGELNKQGEVCAMQNIEPNWFEISYVRRPADRIGYSMKMASAVRPRSTMDYLQLYPGFQIPEDELPCISKYAQDKRQLLQKLSALEKTVQSEGCSRFIKETKKLSKAEKMDPKTLDELRKYEPGRVLKILADHGIVFSPEDFAGYVFGDKIDKQRVKGMKCCLPNIFSQINKNDDDKNDVVNNERFEPSGLGMLPSGLRKMIEQLMEGHSLHAGPAVRRIMRITIIAGPKTEDKEPVKKAEAVDLELAKQYAAYKLAALNYLQKQGKLTEEFLLYTVGQNQTL